MPFGILTPLFIALMLLNWLVEADFRNKFQAIIKNKFALLFIALYCLHLIGLLYTQNLDSGFFDVQVKLSFLLFPLLFGSRNMDDEQLKKIFFAFIAGGIVCSFVMLSRAIYAYAASGENIFFYTAFSFLIHPGYLSMYFNLCIAWLLVNIFNKNFIQYRYSALFSFLIIGFFSFIIVLLSAKIGLITMVLQYIGFLIYYIISQRKYLIGISGILLIVISMYSVIRLVPEIAGRVNGAVAALTNTNTNQAELESTAVRLLIWKAANEVIAENLIVGTGTGDVKDELMKEYEKRGMTGALEHKLNSHNAYYQVFLALGIIGFVLFISNLIFPLFLAFKTSNNVYLLFLLIIMINCFTEAMLETQAGVIFYAFFNSLLCFKNITKKTLI